MLIYTFCSKLVSSWQYILWIQIEKFRLKSQDHDIYVYNKLRAGALILEA